MRRNRILQLATLILTLAAGCSARPDAKTGPVCGGIQGIRCPQANQLCELPAGQCKGADLQGTCEPLSRRCPEIFAPVCGCDGTTYDNDCFRKAAGVAKDHDGAC